MSISVHILDSHPAMKQHRDRIVDAAGAAIRRVRQHLAVSDVDVLVACNPVAAIPELGIGGYCPNGHLVYVSVDPEHARFSELLELHLPRTLAHELHHCARWQGPGYGRSLGEVLVTEGLADHFDLEVHPEQKPYFWALSLDDSGLRELWNLAKIHLWNDDYDHGYWFFNTSGKGPPFHAGYALGFRLVQELLQEHPELRPSELARTPARRIIESLASVASLS